MATLNFPSSPTVDDLYSFSSKTWKWDGTAWNSVVSINLGGVTFGGGGLTASHGSVGGVTFAGNGGLTASHGSVGGVTFSGNGGITASYADLGGAIFGGNIVLQNGEYIDNSGNGTIKIMPDGTESNEYGLEFDFTSWGYGSVITGVKASDGSNDGNIRFDTPVGPTDDKDFNLGSNAHSRIRHTLTGNNTLQIGVKSSDDNDHCSGAVAIIHSAHFAQAYRSPGVTHDNPNLYVYAYNTDANDYIRVEHDGTDANIVTGAGAISLKPASGVVGVNGDIKFSGDYHIRNSSGNSLFDAETGTNIYIGDNDSVGNDTKIYLRDSHSIIVMDAGTSIELDSPLIYIPDKIVHTGDTNTYINFQPDQITMTAGGTDYIDITSAGTNFADTEVVRPKLKDYSETAKATSSKSASFNVDFEDGNVQSFTCADDLTVSFTNPPASGIAGTVTLIITNGGANTTTWNAAVKWPGDNAPALTSSGVDIVSFMTIDAGTTVYGFVGGINFS